MKQWSDILNNAFNNSIPDYVIWRDIYSIVNILNLITKEEHTNHIFYPSGGGMDLLGVSISHESGCIELNVGTAEILKPEKLTFHKMKDVNQSYFRLEMKDIDPITDGNNSEFTEFLCEVEPLHYISQSHLETNEYLNEPLPSSARQIERHLKGSIVIFCKNSIYNFSDNTYNGQHDKYNEQEFYDYLDKQLNY